MACLLVSKGVPFLVVTKLEIGKKVLLPHYDYICTYLYASTNEMLLLAVVHTKHTHGGFLYTPSMQEFIEKLTVYQPDSVFQLVVWVLTSQNAHRTAISIKL